MHLRKWRTNSKALLTTIPETMRETEKMQVIAAPETCRKALGIHWDTINDSLHVATAVLEAVDRPTKRQITSDVARMFDVLGWYAPATVIIKILLQKLWRSKINWDE